MNSNRNAIADYLIYIISTNHEHISLRFLDNEIWATLNQISKIYDEPENEIFRIITELFEDEFNPNLFLKKIDNQTFYAFDIIIQVGFKVNNQHALLFRQWATKLLSEYIMKGFALDDSRLKNCGEIFDNDYFNYLQEDYTEIAASHRSLYQRITDLFGTAYDYKKSSHITTQFFHNVSQLKLSLTKEESNEIINFYLKLANRKASNKIPLMMDDWVYYFTPLFNIPNKTDLKYFLSNDSYFEEPVYYERLSFRYNEFTN